MEAGGCGEEAALGDKGQGQSDKGRHGRAGEQEGNNAEEGGGFEEAAGNDSHGEIDLQCLREIVGDGEFSAEEAADEQGHDGHDQEKAEREQGGQVDCRGEELLRGSSQGQDKDKEGYFADEHGGDHEHGQSQALADQGGGAVIHVLLIVHIERL